MSETIYIFPRSSWAIGVRDFAEFKAEISPFLSLPKELRDKVYGYYFAKDSNNEFEPETVRKRLPRTDKSWIKASLLLTCRSVAAEGTTTLYQDTHFIFNALECLAISPVGIATAGMRLWFRLVGRTNLMKIRSIAIGAKAYDWSDGHPFRAPGARITIMQILHTFVGSSQIRSISINLSLDNFVVAGPKTKNDDIGGVLWYICVLHTLFDDIAPNNINECLRALPNLTSLQIPYRTLSSAMQDWNIPQHHTINVDFLVVLESEQRFLGAYSALLTDIGWRRSIPLEGMKDN